MPGPLPKPGERRQRRNGRGGVGVELRPCRTLAEVPAPPRDWLKVTRLRWLDYWQSEVGRVVEAQTDAMTLVRLFSLYDERERAYRAYKRRRMVPGSQGQPVVNPIWKQAAVMDAEIRQLEDRFGITPQARLKLGIRLGEAMRSLEDMNRELNDGGEDEKHGDPRLAIVRAG